ncbi:2-amino-4-hydroxy-6-hydroxymethyldihydropteridine diphosphokinase [Segnochrobactraceae bacterium EtOH-i3]
MIVREVAFGLGGNIGDTASVLRTAFRQLAASPLLSGLTLSPLWRTPPWGKTDQDWFVNAVAVGYSAADPMDLLALGLGIETAMGRVRAERWGPRRIDIDLLYVGDLVMDVPGLALPHPRMTERGFVIAPLADLRPDRVLAGRTARDRAGDFAADRMERIMDDVPARVAASRG